MSAPPATGGTRERILDAACVLIAEDGIDDVRIARIARVAGVSTALVHYHFDTREALLGEALEHSFDRVSPEYAEDESASAAERLAAMIESSLPGPGERDRDWTLWKELELRALRRPELLPVAGRLYERYHAWIEEAIAEGVRAGELATDDARGVADHVMALIDGLGVRVLMQDPRMDAARIRSHIDRLIGQDLGLPAGWLASRADEEGEQ